MTVNELRQRSRSPSAQGRTPRDPRYLLKCAALALLWIVCFAAVYFESPQLWESPRHGLFIFYQPVAHILCMLWLWTCVVWYFEAYMIRYEACFASEHLKFLLSAKALAELAAAFTTLLALSSAAFVLSCVHRAPEIAAYQPALMYLGVAAIMLNPLDSDSEGAFGPQRWFFLCTLRRVMLPVQAVAFTDFLLADILTSLAKPISDLGVAMCYLLEGRTIAASLQERSGFESSQACGGHMLLIPALLALPFILRFVQCLIIFSTTSDTPQAFNALKYITALPVVFLSWMKYSVPLAQWRGVWKPLWVAAAVVNTSYSFYWDVERDWDIRLFHRGMNRSMLKPDVRMFKSSTLYVLLIVVNLCLRILWTYKLSSHLRHLRWFVFGMTLLEIVRRFLWSFVRIENELRKITIKQPSASPLIPTTSRRKTSTYELADELELAALNQNGT